MSDFTVTGYRNPENAIASRHTYPKSTHQDGRACCLLEQSQSYTTLSWEQHNLFHLSTQSRKPLLKIALHVNHCLECRQETSLWPSFVQLSRPYLWPGKSGAQGQHPVILQESVLPVLSLDIGDDMKPPVPNTMKPSGQGSTNRAAQQVCSSLQTQKSRTMAMSPSQTSQLLPGPSFTSKCSSR